MLTCGKLLCSDLTVPLNGSSADVCKTKWTLGSRKLNLVDDLVKLQWVDFDVDNRRDYSIAPRSVPNEIRHVVAHSDDSSNWSGSVLEAG